MYFFNPIALFALLAAALPIIIHFFNSTKLKKVEFSSIRFLNEIQKSKIKKIKVKNLLLLFLRVAIICFIVLSFARPALESSNYDNFFSASASTSASVILIDDTYPMSLLTQNGSIFNQAKKVASIIIASSEKNDYLSLATFSNQIKDLEFYSDKILIERQLDNISVSNSFTPIHTSLQRILNELKKRKEINKEIFIISNFQQNKFEFNKDYLKNLSIEDKSINIYLIKINAEANHNLAVEKFSLNSKILWKNKKLNFYAVISNRGKSQASSQVELLVNNVPKAQKFISLLPEQSSEISFETETEKNGHNFAEIKIQDNELLVDNHRYLSFYIPENLKVLILGSDEESFEFLKFAISASDSNAQIIRAKNYNELIKLSPNELIEKKYFSSIILVGAKDFQLTEFFANALRLKNGCVFVPSIEDNSVSISNLFKTIGLSQTIEKVEIQSQYKENFAFENINYSHPIFEDLFNKKNPEISSPKFSYYFKTAKSSKIDPIITLNDGSMFYAEFNLKDFGKLLALMTPLNLSASNFALKPIFAPLIFKSILYSQNYSGKNYNALIDDEINIELQQPISQFQVIAPDNTIENLIYNPNWSNSIKYFNLKLPGIYSIKTNEKVIALISSNINPIGSNLNPINFNIIKKDFKEIKWIKNIKIISDEKNIAEDIKRERFGAELWLHFLILALILLFIENILARGSKYDFLEITKTKLAK